MSKHPLFFILTICLLIPLAGNNLMAMEWNKLRSPYPLFATFIEPTPEQEKCPTPPASIHDMEYISVYTDKSEGISIVDKEAQKKYKKQIETIKNFELKIEGWVENSFNTKSKKTENTYCAIQWLYDWAINNSYLDGKTTFQGGAVRKWSLGVLSSHYLQIKNIHNIDNQTKSEIEDWLKRVATTVITEYESKPENKSRNNNHVYWAAWSVMITGIATNNRKFYKWGVRQYNKAINQIQKDGTLPLELERQSKAFHYHTFAAAPLVMMAETMTANGNEAYEHNEGALHKLIELILKELESNQTYISKLTDKKQNLEGTITNAQLAWMEPYYARFKNKNMEQWIKKLRPMIQRRTGGNMTRLYGQPIPDQNDPDNDTH